MGGSYRIRGKNGQHTIIQKDIFYTDYEYKQFLRAYIKIPKEVLQKKIQTGKCYEKALSDLTVIFDKRTDGRTDKISVEVA